MRSWAKQSTPTETFDLSPGDYIISARGDFHGGAGIAQLEYVSSQRGGTPTRPAGHKPQYTPVKQAAPIRRGGGGQYQRVTIVYGGPHRFSVSDAHLNITIQPAT